MTNAFADATDGPPSTEVLPAEESAPQKEEGWSARGLQRLAFWRTEDPPEEEEMRAEIAPTVPSAPPLPPLLPPSAPPHFRYREAECATPVAVQVARPEVARPVAGTSTAPFATVVNVQRIVRGWSARGLQRLASWRATPEEEG